jgi:alcohol dehydrogenase
VKTLAAILYEMGRPAPYRESRPLSVEEVELEGPGPGEVLVEVAAAGLCHSDLSVIDGSRPRPMPMVLGHEAAGIVREVGPGVHELRPGTTWSSPSSPCAAGASTAPSAAPSCARTATGRTRPERCSAEPLHHHLGVSAFSRFTVAAQESLIRIDPEIPLEKAALFGCAVMTGVGAVVNTARVEPGMSVAVFGLGGVGLSVVMGAHLAGAYPIIAVDVRPEKLELARKAGATHGVNAQETDPVAAIRDLTGGGVHYAFESVGSERVLIQAYQATRRGGTTIPIGLPHPERMFSVPAVSIVGEERTIKGSYMGSAVPRRDLPRFLTLYQAGRLPVDLLLSRLIRLEEINEGFDALARGEVVRQVVRLGAA